LQQSGPTSFQIFVQAVLDNGQKGGRVLIAEAAWEQGSVEDGQPGRRLNLEKSVVQLEAILTVMRPVHSSSRIKVADL
jgi:hypothetical protein